MFCTKCGKQIDDDSLFCNSCGQPVQGSVAQPQAQTQPQSQVYTGGYTGNTYPGSGYPGNTYPGSYPGNTYPGGGYQGNTYPGGYPGGMAYGGYQPQPTYAPRSKKGVVAAAASAKKKKRAALDVEQRACWRSVAASPFVLILAILFTAMLFIDLFDFENSVMWLSYIDMALGSNLAGWWILGLIFKTPAILVVIGLWLLYAEGLKRHEDEINGMFTYDRAVCKVDTEEMLRIARDLRAEFARLYLE